MNNVGQLINVMLFEIIWKYCIFYFNCT